MRSFKPFFQGLLFFKLLWICSLFAFSQKNSDTTFNNVLMNTLWEDVDGKTFRTLLESQLPNRDVYNSCDTQLAMGTYFLSKMGDPEKAIDLYDGVIQKACDNLTYDHAAINTANILSNRYQSGKALEYLQKLDDKGDSLDGYTLACLDEAWGQYFLGVDSLDSADSCFREAAFQFSTAGFTKRKLSATKNRGIIRMLRGNYADAENIFLELNKTASAEGFEELELYSYLDLAELYEITDDLDKGLRAAQSAFELSTKQSNLILKSKAASILYTLNEKAGKYQSALKYHRVFNVLKDSLERVEYKRRMTQFKLSQEYRHLQIEDSLELEKYNSELKFQKRQNRIVLFWLLASVLGLLLIVFLYGKIKSANRKAEKLILNILPKKVADELKISGTTSNNEVESTTILFADIKSFTKISAILSPDDLVQLLHDCFSAFDDIALEHQMEKIKTIGDAYMSVGGVPEGHAFDPSKAVDAALAMQEFVASYDNTVFEKYNLPPLQIRIGIHTGRVIAGVVGKSKFQYDVWGDSVNIASRLETNCEPGKVNISKSTYDQIKDNASFTFEKRGMLPIKNRGEIEMYFVSKNSTESD
jgi:adenylate cyclase